MQAVRAGMAAIAFGSALVLASPLLSAPASARPYIQCVAYAYQASGVHIMGDAYQWWGRAAGHYARGSLPVPGSVMAFKSIGRMPLGHVAVVERIVDARHVIINQANWFGPGGVPGGVAYNITVKDVSPRNNWSEVRVGLGRPHAYGSVYPLFGFIYPAKPGAIEVANRFSSEPGLQSGKAGAGQEFAAAPAAGPAIASGAPDRSLW